MEKLLTTLTVSEMVELQSFLTETKRVGTEVDIFVDERRITFVAKDRALSPRFYPLHMAGGSPTT